MKRIVFSLICVGLILSLSRPEAVEGADQRLGRFKANCAVLLAAAGAGLVATAVMNYDSLHLPLGLATRQGTRAAWDDERFAIIQFLGKVLKLRGSVDEMDYRVSVVAESIDDSLEELDKLSYEDFQKQTFLTSILPGRTTGYIIVNYKILPFEIVYGSDKTIYIRIRSRFESRVLLDLRVLQR